MHHCAILPAKWSWNGPLAKALGLGGNCAQLPQEALCSEPPDFVADPAVESFACFLNPAQTHVSMSKQLKDCDIETVCVWVLLATASGKSTACVYKH